MDWDGGIGEGGLGDAVRVVCFGVDVVGGSADIVNGSGGASVEGATRAGEVEPDGPLGVTAAGGGCATLL